MMNRKTLVLLAMLGATYEALALPSYTVTGIGTLPGSNGSQAYDINNSGQIAGTSYIGPGSDHAFLYDKGGMTDLGTLGRYASYAESINDHGQIVGVLSRQGGQADHAFLYSYGVMTDLGTLGGPVSWAYDINSHGQVVGISQTAGRPPPSGMPSCTKTA